MSFRKLPRVSLDMDGRTMPLRIYEANGFLARARGLLGGVPLASDEALWIRPCNSVHTLIRTESTPRSRVRVQVIKCFT